MQVALAVQAHPEIQLELLVQAHLEMQLELAVQAQLEVELLGEAPVQAALSAG